MAKIEQGTPFKNIFDADGIIRLAARFVAVFPAFDTDVFIAAANDRLYDRELKQRVAHIAEALHRCLPHDFPQAAHILIRSLGTELDSADDDDDGFWIWPLTHYVETYGLHDFDTAMPALYEMTKRFSSEFAVRPFIQRYPESSLDRLHRWVTDENFHVRRLVSEGTRPRLPWGRRLAQFQQAPAPVIGLLDRLRDDPELYVRRSVANNLNDIAKDNPDAMLSTLERWAQTPGPELPWMIRHACRSLIKDGHPRAMVLCGFSPDPVVTVAGFQLASGTVSFGDAID